MTKGRSQYRPFKDSAFQERNPVPSQRLLNDKFGDESGRKRHAIDLSLSRRAAGAGSLNLGLKRLLSKHDIGRN